MTVKDLMEVVYDNAKIDIEVNRKFKHYYKQDLPYKYLKYEIDYICGNSCGLLQIAVKDDYYYKEHSS